MERFKDRECCLAMASFLMYSDISQYSFHPLSHLLIVLRGLVGRKVKLCVYFFFYLSKNYLLGVSIIGIDKVRDRINLYSNAVCQKTH